MAPPLVTYVRDPALVPPVTPVTFTGSISINVGDVSIDAVEIKDEADNRAEVPTAGGAKSTSNHVLLVQPVDTAGDVPLQATQEDIDFNTAATNILLATADDHLAAIEQTGTRVEGLLSSENSTLLGIQANTADLSAIRMSGTRIEGLLNLGQKPGTSSLPVVLASTDVVVASNSTTTPLGAFGTFIGAGVDTLGYHTITVHANVTYTGGNGITLIVISFSDDNVIFTGVHTVSLLSVTPTAELAIPPTARYFRVEVTNVAVVQATFQLQTILKPFSVSGVVKNQTPVASDMALVVRNLPSGTQVTTDSQVITDNGAFTDGASKVFMAGYVLDETAGTALTENDAAAARIDSKRAQVMVFEDGTTRGRRATVSPGGALLVDGSAVTQPISGTVVVSNFTAAQSTSGSVVVSNFPETQPISGTVVVSNFSSTPASGSVVVTNFPAIQPVIGTVVVSNFPEAQSSSGSVVVSNFPSVQSVIGTVAVSNFPAVQPVSAASLPLPAGAATESTLAAIRMSGTRIEADLDAIRHQLPPTLGQKSGTDSLSVILATDQPAIDVCSEGVLSTLNATTTPLSAFSSFNGTFEDVSDVGAITVAVLASFVDTVNGIAEVALKFSIDGVDAQIYQLGDIAHGIAQTFIVPPGAKFFRVDVDNFDSDMTSLKLQTTYKCFAVTAPMRDAFPDPRDIGIVTRNIPGGVQTVEGNKANNGSLPGSTNLGVLPAVATVAAPTYVGTAQVALSTDLSGNVRTVNPTQLPVSLGQKTGTNSLSVVLASDQGSVSVSGSVVVSNFPSVQSVSVATLPLPSGAATEDTLSAIRMSGTRIENLIVAENSILSSIQTNTSDLSAIRMSGTRVEGILNAENSTLSSIQTNTADLSAIRMSGTRIESLTVAQNSDISALRMSGTRIENLVATETTLSAIRMSGTRIENIVAVASTEATLLGVEGALDRLEVCLTGHHSGTFVTTLVSNWTSQTTAADNTWYGVAWSPELGLFAAVSTDGFSTQVMTSPNGVNWTAQTNPSNKVWTAITWSPELGLFAAVASFGSTGRVMTSPNGVDWTDQVSPLRAYLGIAWSPELGLFAAVAQSGSGDRVSTSPDGITWTSRTSAANNGWTSVAWSPKLRMFAAVSYSDLGSTANRVMTSADGITWVARTAPDNDWNSITWSPERGVFVAVAQTAINGSQVMTSKDGITWTSRIAASGKAWSSVVWSPELGLFVAVASDAGGSQVMSSSDGITWTSHASASTNAWKGVAWAPELGVFAAIAYTGVGNRAMTSVSDTTCTPRFDVTDRSNRLLGKVTADSLPLPSGAATEATLTAIRMSGTRVEGILNSENSTLSSIQTNTADLSAIRMSGTRVEGIVATEVTLSAIRMSGTRVEGLLNTANSALSSIQTSTADLSAIRMSGTRVEGILNSENSTLSSIQTNTADLSAIRMSGTRVENIVATEVTLSAIRMSGTRVEGLLNAGNSTLSSIQTNTADLSAIRMSGTRIENIVATEATLAAIRMSGTRVEGILNADTSTQAAIRMSGTRIEGLMNTGVTPAFNSGKTINRYVLSQVTTAGSLQINPAVVGQKHKVTGAVLTVSADATVQFAGSGVRPLTGAMDVIKQGGFVIPQNSTFAWIETNANEALSIITTGGGANGVICYITEP